MYIFNGILFFHKRNEIIKLAEKERLWKVSHQMKPSMLEKTIAHVLFPMRTLAFNFIELCGSSCGSGLGHKIRNGSMKGKKV